MQSEVPKAAVVPKPRQASSFFQSLHKDGSKAMAPKSFIRTEILKVQSPYRVSKAPPKQNTSSNGNGLRPTGRQPSPLLGKPAIQPSQKNMKRIKSPQASSSPEEASAQKPKRRGGEISEGDSKESKPGHEAPRVQKPLDRKDTSQVPVLEPKGLKNYKNACYANAVLQCLNGIVEFANEYKTMANGTLERVSEIANKIADLDRRGKATRELQAKRDVVRSAFKDLKELMYSFSLLPLLLLTPCQFHWSISWRSHGGPSS